MKNLILIMVFLSFALATSVWADTHTMSACTSAEWDTVYAAATSGDTIAFPAGTCSVSMTKAIAKTNITVMGNGTGNTTITGGFTCTSPNCNGLRITQIKFVGGTTLQISGSSILSGLRVDNNYFYNVGTPFNLYPNITNSVIDHNTFDGITNTSYVWGSVPRSSPGFPYALGSASGGAGIYFENNVIINCGNMPHFIAQSRGGSRVVIRYNHFTLTNWDAFDAHDNYEGTSESGSATWEYYNNIVVAPGSSTRIWHLRGGQGVVYNNYISSSESWAISLDSYVLNNGTCTKGTPGICSWVIQGAYAWGNKDNCGNLASCDPNNSSGCCTGGSTESFTNDTPSLVLNTDYFNTAMPGYTPYTYPHPLATGGQPPTSKVPSPPVLLLQ